jgi:apolipoprotein N-acyltransferase
VAAGLILALAYPPLPLIVPAFVGLVPLLVFIAERSAGPTGRWSATRGALLAGATYFGLQLYWMAAALWPYSPLAVPAYILSVALLAGFVAAFGWALHYTLERTRLPLAVLAPILWTTLEWTQGRLGPFSFPWLGLGYALTPLPVLAGASDLVGARGLTLWIVAVNGLLAMALIRHRAAGPGRSSRRAVAPLLAGALALTIILASYGSWRAAALDVRPAARVAVIQPNIPQQIRMDPVLALDTSMVMLTRLTLEAGDGAVDLVAWPEVAVTAILDRDDALMEAVRALSRQVAAPILAGAYGSGPHGASRPLFNSAFLVDGRRPARRQGLRYDKRRLVPFVERVPLAPTGRRFGGLAAGDAGATFRLDRGEAFGVLICFEAIFSDLARAYRKEGAGFLVNITNDAWFGRPGPTGASTALWQHPAHLVMRAIETRSGAVRAANTGISGFVDPVGRVYQAMTPFAGDLSVGVVLTTDETTLFVRWGDWLATLAALAALMVVLAARYRPAPTRPR